MNKLNCVLLIDDDEITNKLNSYILQKSNLASEILIAHNGKIALDLLEERDNANLSCPDLILLDINMPVMNGFEFLDAYNKKEILNKSSITIMMLTTSINIRDLEKAKNPLITKFVNKPLSEKILKEIMSENFGSFN